MLNGGFNCCKEMRNFGRETNKMSEKNTKGAVRTGSKLKTRNMLGNPDILVYPTRCNVTQFIYFWKLLYMFRVRFIPT